MTVDMHLQIIFVSKSVKEPISVKKQKLIGKILYKGLNKRFYFILFLKCCSKILLEGAKKGVSRESL